MATQTGKLLRVNLTTGQAKEETVPRDYYRDFLSARGLGVKYLYDEVAPGTDPLSSDNKLIFTIGILGGTRLQGFSKWCVVTKSPLTGTVMRSVSGGNFGVWLKALGYDLLIVEGRADAPSYLYLDEQGIHVRSAKDLMGLDPRLTQARLKQIHGPRTESACIGLAGENLVNYAVITAGERTASRGGVGTVMGAKNLKAIAILATPRKIAGHDSDCFDALAKEQIQMLKTNPRKKVLNTFGTPYLTMGLMEKGILPVLNFREGTLDGVEAISGEVFYKIKQAPAGCYGCMTRCGGMRNVANGPYRGTQIDGPEYETIFSLGALLGISDSQFIVDANAACDFYGIDTISAGVCIAFAFELYENSLLTKDDTGGLELIWGNGNAVLALLEKIARREGIGDRLAEGVKRAAEYWGERATSFAIHSKGLELAGYEPRAVKGYGLSMATSNIGGSHMYGRPRGELAGKVDPHIEHDKGATIAAVQKTQAVEDSLLACTFGNSGLTMEDYARFLSAGTDIEELGSMEHLLRVGERIICLERCFNVREGFSRKDDTLPKRMMEEPLVKAGPATKQKVESLDTLLDEYYQALGYTLEGVPSREKLKELGLQPLAGQVRL